MLGSHLSDNPPAGFAGLSDGRVTSRASGFRTNSSVGTPPAKSGGALAPTMNPFVSASWLDGRDDVAVVDVRDAWEYDSIGHLPGAVNVPFDQFRSDEGEAGKLPPREDWEALLSESGIATDAGIVAYDDTQGVFAARFLVTALLLGHDPEKLHLLDGDFSSWQRDHETTTEAVDPTPTEYESDPDAETPLLSFGTVQDLLPAAEAGDVTLVDTREDWEFAEEHLPGAVQLDWREMVDDESRGLKPDRELREILEDRGITPEKRTVLYCNTARRVSHTYLVLRELGYENVELYEGSLTEWRDRGGELVSA